MSTEELLREIQSYEYTPTPKPLGLDIENIPLDDQATWDLISSGNCKGVFQFESRLGQTWCKKIQPRSITEMSDVTAAIRPGCLQAKNDAGESMTQVYKDTKLGLKSVTIIHPSINDITNATYGIILYQEQAMRIASVMAGFDQSQVNSLRKGIGKKDAGLIMELRTKFIDGCLSQGHAKEDAERVFDIIQKSARYSFNASHSVSYSINSYRSAYLKANYPLEFHLNWLRHAKSKPDTKLEMRELVMSARGMKIDVKTPKWENLSPDFSSRDNTIYFGVSNVKNCGLKDYETLRDLKNSVPDVLTYEQLLLLVLIKCNKRSTENLVTVGMFDSFGKSRTQILHDLSCLHELTKKELAFCQQHAHLPLGKILTGCSSPRKIGGATHTEARSEKLRDIIDGWKNPGKLLQDIPQVYAGKEEELLGVAISYSRVESKGDASLANTTCLEFINGANRKKIIIACEILTVREHKCKNDAVMAFLTVEDETAEMSDILVFGDVYEQEKHKIYEGGIVMLFGERSKDALIISKVELL